MGWPVNQEVMIQIDCDFHIHSRFSAATSKKMTLETISEGAHQKGLNVIATGDALNKFWLEEIEELSFKNGLGEQNGCRFIVTTEVEDRNRVHHLILFRDLESAHLLRGLVEDLSPDIDRDGRPHLRAGGEEIARACHESGALVGPAHAFVPWTSVYKEFNTLKECYGSEKVDFLELGLSADTSLASSISELRGIPFLSNSDAHSASPHRLGREFNRLSVEKPSFEEIRKALFGEDDRSIILNVGLDPRLGKYHRTACIKCYRHFSLKEAEGFGWRCPECRARIKKGVFERTGELRDGPETMRPKYLRIAPLAEIISKVVGVKSVYSKKVNTLWTSLVEANKSEIAVLLDASIESIAEVDTAVAAAIKLYREEKFTISEGGGGRYGEISFDLSKALPKQSKPLGRQQRSLDRF
ncbi:hypothetical protein BMS3Bbin16_00659 [archaeon BMS3Bbin16]|nr:hypothetical protein BMS3Bbin16_00659 [archaeon BMS3Bbin16]